MFAYRDKAAAMVAVIGVSCLMLGALFGGHLFTLITGEFPGPGPGFGQKLGLKVDTVTTVTTANPEKLVTGMWRSLPQVITFWWTLTGNMVAEGDGAYTVVVGRHAGVLTNDGKDWLEDQISDSPSTTPSVYVALTSNAHSPAAADHKLFDEIDSGGGLDRTGGTYASTGVGTWTVTKQFTADGAYVDVQATGLHWSDTDNTNNTMLCADTFTPVTLASSDKITITWTLSVT